MSSLSGQTIQSSYQGLLKLADSSTGITTSLQAIQDGLGNNTGLKIATDQLEAPNVLSMVPLPGSYYGSGIGGDGTTPFPAGSQGKIYAYPFYDQGKFEYSAMTVWVSTATTVSDTIEAAFYTPQMINPNGIFPSEVVLSGISITTTGGTGTKLITFPTNLSFSGYGGGLFFFVWKFTSANNPNVRYRVYQALNQAQYVPMYGYVQAITTLQWGNFWKPNSTGVGQHMYFSGQTTFDNPFPTNLDTLQSTAQNHGGHSMGFVLHTVGY